MCGSILNMINVEALILAVEKRPCLWLISSEEYTNKQLKDIAWVDVASEVFPNWEEFSEDSKLAKCIDLKKKWNNVRDYYRKEVQTSKRGKTGDPTPKRKKYIYSDILTFLNPVFDRRSIEGNCDNINKDEDENFMEEEIPQSNTLTTTDNNDRINLIKTKIASKKNPTANFPSEIRNMKSRHHGIRQKYQDSDTSFLLSFLQDMKEMHPIQKMDFKIGMMTLLKQIKFPPDSYESLQQQPQEFFNNGHHPIFAQHFYHPQKTSPTTSSTPSLNNKDEDVSSASPEEDFL